MINYKSLEMAIRKAVFTYTNEGPYHSYSAFALWQDPARIDTTCTVSSNVLTAVGINPVLGKRVTLTDLGVSGEKYMIPLTDDDFQLANTLDDAKNSIFVTIADGTGTIRDTDITADDTFEVLQSYQVATGANAFLAEPAGYSVDEKAFVNFNQVTLAGPIANLSHILYQFSPNAGNEFEIYAYPSDVYGLAVAATTAVSSGQALRVTAKPYMRVQTDA